jgi:hypothetical protein
MGCCHGSPPLSPQHIAYTQQLGGRNHLDQHGSIIRTASDADSDSSISQILGRYGRAAIWSLCESQATQNGKPPCWRVGVTNGETRQRPSLTHMHVLVAQDITTLRAKIEKTAAAEDDKAERSGR